MNIVEFSNKISACFNSGETSQITGSTKFKSLEDWGSMMALIVIAMIDSDYGKTITSEDLKKAETVNDLFEIVKG